MAFYQTFAWTIFSLPLLACVLITVTPLRRNGQASGWLASGAMLLSTLLALGLLATVAQAGVPASQGSSFAFPPPVIEQRFVWAPTGSTNFAMGLYIDGTVDHRNLYPYLFDRLYGGQPPSGSLLLLYCPVHFGDAADVYGG
jgi:NADH-quinone oxidoreductase subunit L